MKLATPRLKQLIKEELTNLLKEDEWNDPAFASWIQKAEAKTYEDDIDDDEEDEEEDLAYATTSVAGTEADPDLRAQLKSTWYKQLPDIEKAYAAAFPEAKIQKRLPGGAFGAAYTLDNDHILKIFKSGLEGLEAELSNYKELQDKQFAGIAKINEPAIYDFGVIPNTEFHFVEMGKVITLTDWFIMTDRAGLVDVGVLQEELGWFKERLNQLVSRHSKRGEQSFDFSPEFRTKLKELFTAYAPDLKEAGMINSEVMAYFKAVLKLINEHGLGRMYDVHSGNIGVNAQQPSEFVIFDF